MKEKLGVDNREKEMEKKGGKRECYELVLVCGVNCEVNMEYQ